MVSLGGECCKQLEAELDFAARVAPAFPWATDPKLRGVG